MTNKEAIDYMNALQAKCENGYEAEAINLAIKALDLLVRLEGFKYVTTDVMLKEHELAHFDIYKKGWNDAIQAVIDASDMPVTDIIKAIKENEAKQNEQKFTTQVCNGVEIESVDVVGVTTIDNAPTVDTTCPNCDSGYAQGYSDGYLKGKEERPTGHWIDDYAGEVDAEFGRHRYRCSCCGKRANYFIGGLDDWWDMEAPDFCPNCGADMRGGRE